MAGHSNQNPPMVNLFGLFKKPDKITSTIVFDEGYCHSAGPDSGARTYEIAKGTTEIIFVFENFEQFLSDYLFDHPHLPEEVKRSVLEGNGGTFCAQVVEDGPYMCTEAVGPDGHISFRPDSLLPLGDNKDLKTFSTGAIAFGIQQLSEGKFHVLWATMYKTGNPARAA
jgi:hypothetical protein